MARTLFLDPRGGIAGDMLLAGLAAFGLDLADFGGRLDAVVPGVRLGLEPRSRGGFSGVGLCIHCPGAQPLRHLEDILTLNRRLGLSSAVEKRAERAFLRLAEVEAAAHGIPLERVHFHEVGAVDTLIDVAGAFWALEALGVADVVCAPLPWFTGFVQCEHGRLPLPAPAVLRLYEGKPVFDSGVEKEIVTPTGALLVDQIVTRFAPGPEGRVEAQSTAFGGRDIPAAPWGLRCVLLDVG